MIHEQHTLPTVYGQLEVPDGDAGCQQLPVEHTVTVFSSGQSLAKDSQWMPLTLLELFQHCANADI